MLNTNYRQNLANDVIDNNNYNNVYEQQQEQQEFSYKNAMQERQKWHLTAADTETSTTPSTPARALNNNSFSFDSLHQNYEYVCDIRMMNLDDTLANDTSEENKNYTQAAAFFDESAYQDSGSISEKEKQNFNAKDLDEFFESSSSSSENSIKSYDSSRSNSTSSNDLSTNSGNTGSSNNSRCSSNGNCSLDSGVYDDLRQLYLNEVEVELNRADEEATISELVKASNGGGDLQRESSQNNRMRIAFGIILRLVLPLANGVARSIQGFRDVRFLHALKKIATSRQALTNVIAFAANTISMSLSSVQVSHRLEPLLKLMKISKSRSVHECLPDTPTTPLTPTTPTSPITTTYSPFLREPRGVRALPAKPTDTQPAPKCCTLNILAEPPAGTPIRADIVFIHGLHGSLVNTWKQGLWENERRPVGFERPPKLPLRPPKRPRHSRTSTIRPPHKKKRARFHHSTNTGDQQLFPQSSYENDDYDVHEENERGHRCSGNHAAANDFSYICGAPEDIQFCDGLEYSFPTFRLRMNDRGRQLQAELESILHGDSSSNSKQDDVDINNPASSPKRNSKKKSAPATPKPSANDPNYSKCWPGDWLPLDCPGVRVIAVNYTTDQYLWRPLWKPKESRTNLVQRSREMTELLIAHRVGYGHPIVWVGHSKGGLFVKQIIVDAWESGRPATAPFWRSARGVFFYSVPHRGSHLASIKAPLLTRSVELIDIEKNSKYLIDLHRRFACLYQLGHLKIEVFSFVETALTLMSVLYMRIVGVDSADPGIGDVCGIHLDHREICKPRSRECILYKELVKMINKVC